MASWRPGLILTEANFLKEITPTLRTGCAAKDLAHVLEDDSKLLRDVGHKKARTDRKEAGQKGVFDKILSAPVLEGP
jgi:hypothetical protein